MKILDMTAGNRAVWFDKNYRDCIYVDLREQVRPTVVCDTRYLPFADAAFDLVVFDPPHVNAGKGSNTSKSYGWHTTQEIKAIITGTAQEAYRICRPGSFMAFKWNDHDQRLGPVLALMSDWWEALFGHSVAVRMKRRSETFWTMLLRRG